MSGSAPALEVSMVMVGALLRPATGVGESRSELASESAIDVVSYNEISRHGYRWSLVRPITP